VRVGAGTDVVDVAVLVSDYSLITIPVIGDDGRMIGVITVDYVLEVTLPKDWGRRDRSLLPPGRSANLKARPGCH
jgi:CBS domain-containing protein